MSIEAKALALESGGACSTDWASARETGNRIGSLLPPRTSPSLPRLWQCKPATDSHIDTSALVNV